MEPGGLTDFYKETRPAHAEIPAETAPILRLEFKLHQISGGVMVESILLFNSRARLQVAVPGIRRSPARKGMSSCW